MKFYLFLWLLLVGTAAASAQTTPPQGPFVLTLDEKNLILLLTKGEKLVAPIQPEIRGMVDSVDLSFKPESKDPRVQQLIDRFIDDLSRLQAGEEILNDVRRDILQPNQNTTNDPQSQQNFRAATPNREQEFGGTGSRTDSLSNSQFDQQRTQQNNSILTEPRTQNSGNNPNDQFSVPPPRSGANTMPEFGNPLDGRRVSDFDRRPALPTRRTEDSSSLAQRPFEPWFENEVPDSNSGPTRPQENNGNDGLSLNSRDQQRGQPDRNLVNPGDGAGQGGSGRFVESRNSQNNSRLIDAEIYRLQQLKEQERLASTSRMSTLPPVSEPTYQTQRMDPAYDSLRATIQDLQDQNKTLIQYLQDTRNPQTRHQFTEVGDQDYVDYSHRQASNRQVPTMMLGSIEGPQGVQTNQGVSTPPLAQAELEKIKSTNTVIWFMLLFSIGLNFYLAWLARTFYARYADLADELRETFTASS